MAAPGAEGRGARDDLRDRAREMRGGGETVVRAGKEAFHDLDALARDQMQRRPYVAIGALFAAGYVLGGGLPPRVVGFALGIGARVAATALAGQLAASVAEEE